MKIKFYRFSAWFLLLLIMAMMESCSGCSHRSKRARERHRERVERRESNEDKGEQRSSRRSRSQITNSSMNYSEEQIASIAEGEDYDAMLDCQFAKLNEIKQLKDEYFRGDMSDKTAEGRMKEIEQKFSPIDKALDDAQSEGLLTYNQHKRQLKLMGDYLKVVKAMANRVGSDISSYIDL